MPAWPCGASSKAWTSRRQNVIATKYKTHQPIGGGASIVGRVCPVEVLNGLYDGVCRRIEFPAFRPCCSVCDLDIVLPGLVYSLKRIHGIERQRLLRRAALQ